MNLMRLYRGIAVRESLAPATMEAIRRDGLVVGAGFWGLKVHDLKPQLEILWRSSDLSIKSTRPCIRSMAQLEHFIRNDGVTGSNPVCGTNQIKHLAKF